MAKNRTKELLISRTSIIKEYRLKHYKIKLTKIVEDEQVNFCKFKVFCLTVISIDFKSY